MHIASLIIYPVKSLRPISLDLAQLEQCGLADDRRWAIVDQANRVLTQRDLPGMATIDAWPRGTTLRLEAAHRGGVDARPEGHRLILEIWRQHVPARAANPEASEWLARVLGRACTLAYLDDAAARPVTPDLARPGDVVNLADGFPLLVTTTASLAALNSRLSSPVPMIRFRPNLVIDGAMPWAEDTWSHIAAGSVRLRLASPCARCKVISLDQQTGLAHQGLEPLKTLASFRRDTEGKVTFGYNAVPEALGALAVGQELTAYLHR